MEVLIHMDVLVHVSACIVIAVGKKTFFAMIYAHIIYYLEYITILR